MMEIGMLSKSQLKQLRKEIALGSLYIADYENSFEIDPHKVCEFFDGFIEEYENRPQSELVDTNPTPNFMYDTIENLWEYYCCIDWEFYNVEQLKIAM